MGKISDQEIKSIVKSISGRFLKLRMKQKLTQEDTALISGVSRSSLARLESGEANPSLETMIKLAAAYGYKMDVRFTKMDTNKDMH